MFQDSVPAGSYNDPFLSSVCVEVQMNAISPPHPTPQEMSATQHPPREHVNMNVNSPPHTTPPHRPQTAGKRPGQKPQYAICARLHVHTFGF